MIKKLSFAGLGLLLLASPLLSFAQTDDTPPDGTPPQTGVYCPHLVQTMQRGARDATTVPQGQVSELQAFLTDYYNLNDGLVVGGFFGPLTQRYVIQFQREQGLPTFGIVGSLTRAAIARVCGNTPPPPPLPTTFSASPTWGQSPLPVSFTWSSMNATSLNFGDGQTVSVSRSGSATHTYNTGTFSARLISGNTTIRTTVITVANGTISCPVYNALVCPRGQHVVSDPDTFDLNGCRIPHQRCVDNPATISPPAITGLDAPTSLTIGQTGTWTVHASVSGPDSHLSYSVVWGDGGGEGQNPANGSDENDVHTSGTFTHAYAQAGTYPPRFTVSNSAGSAQTSATVVVSASPPPPPPPASCTWNGQTIASGSSVTAYQSSSVPSGSQCVSETRTCNNGTLSGSYTNASCTVAGGGGGTTSPVSCVSGPFNSLVDPQSGAAPLTVRFRYYYDEGSRVGLRGIDFGDGTQLDLTTTPSCQPSFLAPFITGTHTYVSPGKYIVLATFKTSGGTPYSMPMGLVTVTAPPPPVTVSCRDYDGNNHNEGTFLSSCLVFHSASYCSTYTGPTRLLLCWRPPTAVPPIGLWCRAAGDCTF